jgi:hypothetical protein
MCLLRRSAVAIVHRVVGFKFSNIIKRNVFSKKNIKKLPTIQQGVSVPTILRTPSI